MKEDPGSHTVHPSLNAAKAIKQIDAAKAVPLFAERLSDVSSRFWAATFLMEIEPPSLAEPAIPQLVEAVRAAESCETDDERWACTRAASALGRIEPDGIDALVRQMTHDSVAVRRCAIGGVPRFSGRDGFPAVPALCRLLDDEDVGVRQAAAHAIGQVGDDRAIPLLEEALARETDRSTKINILGALQNLRRPR